MVHRSRHCLVLRPVMWAATSIHRPTPCFITCCCCCWCWWWWWWWWWCCCYDTHAHKRTRAHARMPRKPTQPHDNVSGWARFADTHSQKKAHGGSARQTDQPAANCPTRPNNLADRTHSRARALARDHVAGRIEQHALTAYTTASACACPRPRTYAHAPAHAGTHHLCEQRVLARTPLALDQVSVAPAVRALERSARHHNLRDLAPVVLLAELPHRGAQAAVLPLRPRPLPAADPAGRDRSAVDETAGRDLPSTSVATATAAMLGAGATTSSTSTDDVHSFASVSWRARRAVVRAWCSVRCLQVGDATGIAHVARPSPTPGCRCRRQRWRGRTRRAELKGVNFSWRGASTTRRGEPPPADLSAARV